jgi:hypothetical protein
MIAGVGVAAGDRRHDRGVAHAQPVDATHLEVGADDGQLVTPIRQVLTLW